MDLHSFITTGSYIAIFFLMLTNGALNVPSSQLLYLVCGYFISTGSLLFIPTIILGTLGNVIGNTVTFLLIKKYGKPLAQKLLMMNDEAFTKVHSALNATFMHRGMWWIFFGKLIPSVKAFIPMVAGLAHTQTKLTVFIFLVASAIWACMITSIGYFFGEHVSLATFSSISLLVGGVIIFTLYKKFYKKLSL